MHKKPPAQDVMDQYDARLQRGVVAIDFPIYDIKVDQTFGFHMAFQGILGSSQGGEATICPYFINPGPSERLLED